MLIKVYLNTFYRIFIQRPKFILKSFDFEHEMSKNFMFFALEVQVLGFLFHALLSQLESIFHLNTVCFTDLGKLDLLTKVRF